MSQFLAFEKVRCEFNLYSALRGISFALGKGENLVIFGTENSGIDGICSIIAGIQKHEGDVVFQGMKVHEMNHGELNKMRREIVYLQRNYGLLSNMTVEENIALPLRYHSKLATDTIEESVNKLIDELHLDYCRDMRPMHLKPSEILKASYARSLILDPDLILVEHPLEGQCLLNTITFIKNLKKRCESADRSILIVTYEPLRFLDFADRFIMIDYGKIVFDGPREKVLNPNNEFVQQFLSISGDGPMQIL
jgi:phospholipid/cholesterol/gamma-HCH transport system ATP-binding protein